MEELRIICANGVVLSFEWIGGELYAGVICPEHCRGTVSEGALPALRAFIESGGDDGDN